MNKVIVLAKASNPADWQNFLQDAKADQALPQGVEKIFDNSWLIDVHTSLPFFASLVYNALFRNISLAVFEIDGEPLLKPGKD